MGATLNEIDIYWTCTVQFYFVLGLVGLSLSYALSVTGQLNSLITQFSETEKQMVSVERSHQYITQVPHETQHAALEVSSNM